MKTLVIGATGNIGKAVSNELKEHGHDVVEASRKSLASIDIENSKSIEDFFSNSSELDVIVCAAGAASFGKLSDLNSDQINHGLQSKLLGQINVVKHGVKRLKPGGVIVLTGGMLAYSPWPETSNIATVNAGLEGFVKAAALELENNRRVMIVHPPLISESAAAMGMDPSPWPSSATVAKTYVSALSSLQNGTPVFVKGYAPELTV